MTYRTTLILSAILLAILALVYWLADSPASIVINSPTEVIDQDADYFLTDALIKEHDITGSLKYQLKSDSITHYPYNDHTLLQMPVLKNQGDNGQITTSRADNGKLLPGGDDIELWDNVVVIQDNTAGRFATGIANENNQSTGRVRMDTDFVTISLKEEVADTHRPVLIITDNGETRATGMTAYFQQGQIHLKSRVRGTYEPE
ncbi:LPS export ABC transporter periplasmic protein LptC [uncultured Endozoicomonas sp.]|uniref:LPS export ABC transporter periplasmic protein LptC n=1 Tax=uncultured Endozoicomonas sp. TaxID=432652 RepID=UPI00261227FD|nr:LPS export ABC transporter periplasmic protein LptC [uncultured Endozoicomonas sp.]